MSLGMRTLEYLDFNSPSTSRNQTKTLYSATIAARLAASRSKEEFRETFTRDIPSWATLFYVAGIVENALGFVLDKMSPASQSKEAVSLIKGPENTKNFLKMLNPFTKHKVRSFDDIKALKGTISEQNFKELMRNKSAVFAVGMLAPIIVLGMFIPWLNVQITRKEVLEAENKEKSCKASPNEFTFAPNVNLTPDPNFKPNQNTFNRIV
jgi:hypothetical protein